MSFMSQLIFVVLLLGGLMGAFVFLKGKGRLYWLSVMGGCLLSVVSGEIYSKITTGLTISQHYWRWSVENETQAIISLTMLLLGWLVLLHHLSLKLLKKWFTKKPEA